MNKFEELKFKAKNNKKYKLEAIRDNAIYIKKDINQLIRLYFLVF